MLSRRVVVGRQSIKDRAAAPVGYELLFRATADADDSDGPLTGEQMTADVVLSANDLGLEYLVGGKQIFVNADRATLLGDIPIGLPPGQTVVEVLETVDPDADVIEGLHRLDSLGYRLALDDFVWSDASPALLELASIVKIDIQAVAPSDLPDLARRCSQFGVQLLAEKVETETERQLCLDLGFEYYQGYLIERPVIVTGRTLDPGEGSRLQMAGALLGDDPDLDELERLIRRDPSLAYQIMRLASIGRPGETRRAVNTIRDALVIAGSRRVRQWMALLLVRPQSGPNQDAFFDTLVRARACELLVSALAPSKAPIAFAAGMLSAMDLLLGIALTEVQRSLQISGELADAAFGDRGEVGQVVRAAIDYQLRTPDRLRTGGHVGEADLEHAFIAAFDWAARTASVVHSDGR